MPGRATNEPTNYFAIGKQSAKDQEATTFEFIKHLDGSGFDTEPDIAREREGGDGQEVGLSYKKLIKTDGQAIRYSRPETTARAFMAVLGTDTPTAVGAGVLTDHYLTPAPTIPFHTVEQSWAGEVERTTNVKFSRLDLEWEAGGPLKITTPFVSGGTSYRRDVASALTPVRETGKPLMYAGASVVVAGASGAKLTKGKITVERQLDDGIQTTSLNREDVVELNQDYSVDGTLKWENAALWERANYGGGSMVAVDLATIGLDLTAGVGQGSYQLRAVAPLLEVTAIKVNRLDPDGKTMYLDFTAMSIKAATYPFFAVVRTAATSAY